MNTAKIYSTSRKAYVSSTELAGMVIKIYLAEAERQLGIEDQRPKPQRRFRRPYPYTHRDNPKGYEEHEWISTTDRFPVR